MFQQPSPKHHAIVLGGSIAGLMAARVLADHFERVTVIERDHLPEGDENRPCVPQGHHIHTLMLRGQLIMERLFPGLEAELLEAGAPAVEQGQETRVLYQTGWAPVMDTGLTIYAASRALLESRIRRRINQNPQIEIRDGYEVVELLADESRRTVTGVQMRQRGGQQVEYLRADLVVDASGRSSKTPDWLEQLGYARPQETVIQARLGYASRWYAIPEDFRSDWKAIWIQPKAPFFPRGGVLMPAEGNRWVVTLFGTARDYPPTDETAFLGFARSLLSRRIYHAIKNAEPLTPVYGYRRTANRWRHYERMARLPERLLVMGDAFVALNPSYGQGMTAAALAAETLAATLRGRRSLNRLWVHFHRRLARAVGAAWMLSTHADLRWPTTEGGRVGLLTAIMQGYTDRVAALIPHNPALYQVYLETLHGLRPSSVLFAPSILKVVFQQAFKHQTAQPAPVITSTQEMVRVGSGR